MHRAGRAPDLGLLCTTLPRDTLLTVMFPYGSRNSAGNDTVRFLSSAAVNSSGAIVAVEGKRTVLSTTTLPL